MTKKPLVEIEWRDSHRYTYQMGQDEPVEVAIMRSVGYLISQTKDKVVIAQDLIGDDMRGIEVICRENIIKQKSL